MSEIPPDENLEKNGMTGNMPDENSERRMG